MKQGKEVKPNVPSIELTPKCTEQKQEGGKKKTARKKSSSLFTCGPFGDFKAPAPCLESETNGGQGETFADNCQVHFQQAEFPIAE